MGEQFDTSSPPICSLSEKIFKSLFGSHLYLSIVNCLEKQDINFDKIIVVIMNCQYIHVYVYAQNDNLQICYIYVPNLAVPYCKTRGKKLQKYIKWIFLNYGILKETARYAEETKILHFSVPDVQGNIQLILPKDDRD